MTEAESKQNQYMALFLVVLGLSATAVGCHFHWPELTTASAGVWGGGLGLLKGSTMTQKAAGIPVVSSPDPS